MRRHLVRKTYERLARRLLRVGWMRRWYARRLVALIDRSKRKRRHLVGDLSQIARVIRPLPKSQRAATVAKLLEPVDVDALGRVNRRAAARQGRMSGQHPTRQRPGLPPAARRQGGAGRARIRS